MTGARTPADVHHAESRGRVLYWWLLIAIFFEYARPSAFLPVLGTMRLQSLVPLGLVAACVFAAGLRPMRDAWSDPVTRWLIAFFGLIALSLTHAEVTLYAFNVTKTVLGYVLLAFVIVRICTTPARIHGVLAALVLSHLFLLAANTDVLLNPQERNYIDGGSFLGDGNDFSLSLCILLPMCAELAIAAKARFSTLFWWGALVVLCLTVIATQSRGGTLGMMAVAGYLWLRSPRKLPALLVVVGLVLLVFAYAPDQYFDRMRSLTSYTSDGSAMGRITAWKSAMWMARDNPFLGVGAGMFPVSFGTDYRPPGAENMPWLTAHSMYFLVLGELALPGIIVFLGLLFQNFRSNRRLIGLSGAEAMQSPGQQRLTGVSRVLYLLNASLIGFAVAGAFLSVAYYPHVFVLSALMVSARLAVRDEAGEKAEVAAGRLRRPHASRGRGATVDRGSRRRPGARVGSRSY